MNKYLLIALLAGCASSSGPVQIGRGMYSLLLKSYSPSASMTDLKTDAYKEAAAHCAKEGKLPNVHNTHGVPRAIGQFPEVEVQFSCA